MTIKLHAVCYFPEYDLGNFSMNNKGSSMVG